MRSTPLTRYLTGIVVPVSALRTESSLGIGEFADIPALAAWCADVGLDLIQILPVNDTGWQASPYSAVSAFALHPIYLRIDALPEYGQLTPEARSQTDGAIAALRAEHGSDEQVRYNAVLDAKDAIIRRIYDDRCGDPEVRDAARGFLHENEWVRAYAAYKVLKAENDGASWKEWPDFRDPTPEILETVWADERRQNDLRYHAWVQLRLDEQLRSAAAAAAERGVLLKGDLPILINDDSADAWAQRNYFSTRLRAGAPPDAQSVTGQNWGLPIYDWAELARDDYHWWKNRLIQAARYYAAYRIDHVLGFFRVWSIPADDFTGYLGHFTPCASASRERLHEVGLDNARIRWLAEPHIPGAALAERLGDEMDALADRCLRRIEGEDIYLFAPTIRGERDILSLECSDTARDWLLMQYRDRALIRLEHDTFVPVWSHAACSRFDSLSDDERHRFESLVAALRQESEELWEAQARRLLGFMRGTTDMLACAEDLGAIPDCVPRVLEDLGILGLRIPRWTRRWDDPGQPFIPPVEYPVLTVCAPSVHDTSTMRGWWREDDDQYRFWRTLGFDAPVSETYDAATARRVIEALLRTSSAICVMQIQDLCALVDGLVPDDPNEERVNVPGTVDEANWSYRAVPLESLAARDDLKEVLAPMLAKRRSMTMEET